MKGPVSEMQFLKGVAFLGLALGTVFALPANETLASRAPSGTKGPSIIVFDLFSFAL